MKEKQLLEELRSKLVGILHTQPFTIYTDAEIEALLKARPKTLEELVKIKGFPDNGKRVRTFGKAIIAIFNPPEEKTTPVPAATSLNNMQLFSKNCSKSIKMIGMVTLASLCSQFAEVPVSGSNISQVQEEINLVVEKSNFLKESKETSKTQWLNLQESEYDAKVAAEEEHLKLIEKRRNLVQREKKQQKKKTLKVVKKQLKRAIDVAVQTSVDVDVYAASLKENTEVDTTPQEENVITEDNSLKESAAVYAANFKKSAEAKQVIEKSKCVSYSIGNGGDSSVKSWMPHCGTDGDSIFWKESEQYALQQKAVTGKYGIRTVNGRYCIAVGSRFCSAIGTKIDVVLENGTVIECILGDQKADKDTDVSNSYHLCDGSYVEFIVDRDKFNQEAKRSGNVSSIEEFAGKVTEIRVYEEE